MGKILKKLVFIIIIIIILWFILVPVLKIDVIIMKKIYPKKYEQYVRNYSKEYNVDELLIFAIIKTESNFKTSAKSKSNAKGLMQLMENTAIEIAEKTQNNELDVSKIYEPEVNLKLGIYYFSTLLNQYNNIGIALVAYNAGMGRVDEWIEKGIIKPDGSDLENIPYQETNMYVRKVLNNYKIYQDLYSTI